MIRIDIVPKDALLLLSTKDAKELQKLNVFNNNPDFGLEYRGGVECYLLCNGTECTLNIKVYDLTPDNYKLIWQRQLLICLAVFQSMSVKAINSITLVTPDSMSAFNTQLQQKARELDEFVYVLGNIGKSENELKEETPILDFEKAMDQVQAGITKEDELRIAKGVHDLLKPTNKTVDQQYDEYLDQMIEKHCKEDKE